jgi:hypothetical protein
VSVLVPPVIFSLAKLCAETVPVPLRFTVLVPAVKLFTSKSPLTVSVVAPADTVPVPVNDPLRVMFASRVKSPLFVIEFIEISTGIVA